MAKDLNNQINETIEFIASIPGLTLDERAQAILNFAKKLEREKKITLKPTKNVFQGLKK